MLALLRSYSLGPGQFRVLLALAVLGSHVAPLETGRVAVVLFFMLSGYWVTTNYRRRYDFSARSILHFFLGRILRIFPTYYLILLLTVGAVALFLHKPSIQLADITLFGLARAHHPFIIPAWSLDIELQFYLLVPLFVWAVGRQPSTTRVFIFLACAAAISVAAWIYDHVSGAANLPRFAISFAVGAAIAFTGQSCRRPLAMISLATFLGLGVVSLALPATRWMLHKQDVNLVHRDIVALLWASVMVPFVMWVVRQPSGIKDQHLGNVAFTLYLAQWFFVSYLDPVPLFKGISGGLLTIALVGVTTALIYFLAEAPIERWRQRILAFADPGRAGNRLRHSQAPLSPPIG